MQTKIDYIRNKMKQLREDRGYSLQMMSNALHVDKSNLSRAENGQSSNKKIMEYFEKYCTQFKFTAKQKEFILSGFDVILLDTSTLLSNPQIIDELDSACRYIIISNIVISELTSMKRRNEKKLGNKAWIALSNITKSKHVKRIDYNGLNQELNNDEKIIEVAKQAVNEFDCNVVIISNDIDYKAYLKDNEKIKVITLNSYMATVQELPDMEMLDKIDKLNLENYDCVKAPNSKEINAHLSSGYTLIISTVRSNMSFELKCKKIKWLMENGADIDKRDNAKYHFPPLTHAVQMKDAEMVKFLLQECNANPNVGSKDPYRVGELKQKNEGNMPLMVACYGRHASPKIVRILCSDKRTSLNQQDSNGFTAYIKASMWGHTECRNILEDAGADLNIVDLNGMTGEDHYDRYIEQKLLKEAKNGR